MKALPPNSKLIFRGIVGSQSYGLATKDSDTDYKSIYIQSNDDILSGKYIPQIDVTKDDVAYELRRFLELLVKSNPNVLELLYIDEEFILHSSPEYKYLRSIRNTFLSKEAYHTFSGYAMTQLGKAKGLNKKFNWESNRVVRKDIADFTTVIDRSNGLQDNLKSWLKKEDYVLDQLGLVKVDNFRDTYKVYTDDIKWSNDNVNHRFDKEIYKERNYKGFGDEKSNEPRLSVIEKYRINDWKCIAYFNREEYSRHCKEYREYNDWIKNRNEKRVATNKKHGQQMDSKNIMHTVRLLLTAKEIPTENKINVNRSADREYLLKIRNGEVDLQSIVDEWKNEIEKIKVLYEESSLQEKVEIEYIQDIELKIRKGYELSNS